MMKITSALFFALGFGFLVALAADKPTPAEKKASPLVGTWEIVSEKWNDAKDFTPAPSDRKALKFITPTHFIWVHIDPKTKKISNSMGGSYTHDGNSYTETVEFVFEGMEAYLGKEQKFTAKIEGDKWTISGVLSEGQKLEEIWKRVK